jgi:hypothetical protein
MPARKIDRVSRSVQIRIWIPLGFQIQSVRTRTVPAMTESAPGELHSPHEREQVAKLALHACARNVVASAPIAGGSSRPSGLTTVLRARMPPR